MVIDNESSGDEPGELSHLHASARWAARLPTVERLRYVRADRWIGYTRASEALARGTEGFGPGSGGSVCLCSSRPCWVTRLTEAPVILHVG
jgi:hypothetical protein